MKIFLFFFFVNVSFAQDFVIEDEDSPKSWSITDYIKKKFTLEASGSYGAGALTTTLATGGLGFEDQWGPFYTKVLAQYYYSKFSLEVEKRETKVKEEFSYEKDGAEIHEAYGRLKLGEKGQLSIGRQKILWGQLEVISPVDFVLPLNFRTFTNEISRTHFRLPSDAAVATFFPVSRWEVSLYYMPKIKIDPTTKEAVLRGHHEIKLVPHNSVEDTEGEEKKSSLPSGFSGAQKAVRTVYYGDWATIGLTYYHGPWWINPAQRYTYRENEGVFVPDPGLVSVQMYGVEFSKSWARWSFKAESAYFSGGVSDDIDVYQLAERRRDGKKESEVEALLNWIQEENKNKAYVSLDRLLSGVGVSYNSSSWNFHFSVLYLANLISSSDQKGIDLSQKVSGDEDSPLFIIPAFLLSHKLGSQKNHHLGLALGYLGSSAGGSFFWEAFFGNIFV